MVITIELNAVPNNFIQRDELKNMIDSFHSTFHKELGESVRAAQSVIRTANIADISAAANQLANAMSEIQFIDYGAEFRQTTQSLKEAMIAAQAVQDQQMQELKDIIASIRFTELDLTGQLADTLMHFKFVLDEAAVYNDDFSLGEDEDEDEDDLIDEKTAEILATVTCQMQTAFEPEQAVSFERLRAFFSGITWEKAKAIIETIVLIISLVQGFMPDEDLQRNNELTEALIVHEQEADATTYEQNEQIIELLTGINDKLAISDTTSISDNEGDLPKPSDEIPQQSSSEDCHDGKQ